MVRTSINENDEQGKKQEANEETSEEEIKTRYIVKGLHDPATRLLRRGLILPLPSGCFVIVPMHYNQDKIRNPLAKLNNLHQISLTPVFSTMTFRFLFQLGWNCNAKPVPSNPLCISASQFSLSFADSIGMYSAFNANSSVLFLKLYARRTIVG
jgi:hypothetical protein